jgi:putative membrane protein insertion efficiency factor
MKRIALALITAYQSFSATREPRCKYYPSCSNYAATAIRRYGFKGLAMASWRLLRCNPWSHGGVDYVDYELDSAEALANKQNTMVSHTNERVQ